MIWSISSGGSVMSAACWCCSEDIIVWIGDFDLAERKIVLTGSILIRMRDEIVRLIDYMYFEPRCCGGVQYHDGRSAVFNCYYLDGKHATLTRRCDDTIACCQSSAVLSAD